MPDPGLGLNEALLIVNKINLKSPVEVLYQINECFGCPLKQLKPHLANLETLVTNATSEQVATNETIDNNTKYVLGTSYSFRLELRHPNGGGGTAENVTSSGGALASSSWCKLDDVSLNNQGQYQVDVSPAGGAELTVGQSLLCTLKTINSGECLLCPFAVLICIIFAFVGLERMYTKFWMPTSGELKRANYERAVVDRKLSSAATGQFVEGADSEQEIPVRSSNNYEQAENGAERSSIQTDGADGRGGGDTLDVVHERDVRTNNSLGARVPLASDGIVLSQRIESLDVFRGLTLAGMIFVNYGGAGYSAWEHTPWDGITLADFVFPFFIFSMGASVAISVRSLVKRHTRSFGALAMKILRRSILLALIGVCLNSKWIDYSQLNGFTKLRLTGVLQRFSISYLIVALMYCVELLIAKWIRAQSLTQVPYLSKLISILFELLTAINYLGLYVYFTFFFDYNEQGGSNSLEQRQQQQQQIQNCPIGYTGPGGLTEGGRYAACTGGAAAWLDRLILGTGHIYNDREVKKIFMSQVSHDPEGILGYTTSILLTLIGLQCGKILIACNRTHKQKLLALGQWTVALMLASSLVLVIPVNKRLWSLTFVIVTALAAFIIITFSYVLIDLYSCKKSFLLRLVSSAGKNSIFLYVGHSLISGMLPWWFPIADQTSHLQLLLRLSWCTFIWLLIAHYMALKGLFIRV